MKFLPAIDALKAELDRMIVARKSLTRISAENNALFKEYTRRIKGFRLAIKILEKEAK